MRPLRLEESLQTPGGTVQRDHGLAGPWDSKRKIALSGFEIGVGEVRERTGAQIDLMDQ